jgi:hypothetical protein
MTAWRGKEAGGLARSRRCAQVVLTAVAMTLVLTAGSARAATYTVLSCQDRNGSPVPASDAAGGWVAGNSGEVGLASVDRCNGSSKDLLAAVSGPWSYPVGARAWWRFVAPPYTMIDSFGIRYWASTRPWDNRNEGLVVVRGSASGTIASLEGRGLSPESWLSLGGMHDAYLEVLAQCDGPVGYPDCDANQVHAEAHVERSEFTLADELPPTAGAATGSAVASGTWQGTELFAFPATDQGGGIYQAILEVDGTPTLTRTVDEWGGRCVDTTAGQHVFRFPRPCLTSVDAVFAVDANALPAGDHDVTLRISDAAGNLGTVYSARKTIVVPARRIGPGSDLSERGAANGANASDSARLTARWTRTRRSTLTGPYGRRQVVRGRLSDAQHVGIRDARIELLSAIDGRASGPLDKGGARTRDDGRFTLILPCNVSSRTLVLRYRSHVNDTVAVAERILRLKVRAAVNLAVRPRVTSRGHTVRLTGRLVGRPLPHEGKVVELQARSPGEKWITFRTIRATRRGRFATRYTFRRGGPATYQMRARVRAADDYPYATGASHAVRVRVR